MPPHRRASHSIELKPFLSSRCVSITVVVQKKHHSTNLTHGQQEFMLHYFKKSILTYRYLHIHLEYSHTKPNTNTHTKAITPKTYLCLDIQILISEGTYLVGDSYQLW